MYLKQRKQNTGELLMPNFFQKKLSPCLFMPAISNRWGSVYNPIFPTFKVNLPKKLGSNSVLHSGHLSFVYIEPIRRYRSTEFDP